MKKILISWREYKEELLKWSLDRETSLVCVCVCVCVIIIIIIINGLLERQS